MQKKNNIGFGIIGSGAIANHHAKSIQELENTELLAVCSSTPKRAEVASKRFGVPAYSDLYKFLNRKDIDVVCVCTESGRHLEAVISAAKAGKHILVEKPLEINLERAERILKVCKEYKVQLGVIFQNRFNTDYKRIKQAIQNEQLGKLILGNAYVKWFREKDYYLKSDWKGTLKGDGGAALINQGIHTIDLLLDLMQDVHSVFGRIKTMVHNIEGEDIGVAILNFKTGALGTIVASTALYPGYPERLEIFGEKGSIIYEGGKIIQWNLKDRETDLNITDVETSSGASDPLAVDYVLHKTQIQDFVEAIMEDRQPEITGYESLKSLALIEAIYQSSSENKQIYL